MLKYFNCLKYFIKRTLRSYAYLWNWHYSIYKYLLTIWILKFAYTLSNGFHISSSSDLFWPNMGSHPFSGSCSQIPKSKTVFTILLFGAKHMFILEYLLMDKFFIEWTKSGLWPSLKYIKLWHIFANIIFTNLDVNY